MNRRTTLKSLILGTLAAVIQEAVFAKSKNGDHKLKKDKTSFKNGDQNPFQSQWQLMPDMTWPGEEFWAQRLQDWEILNGEVQCNFCGPNRTLNILTHQINEGDGTILSSVDIKFPSINFPENKNNISGFRLGIKGRFDDYRSAVITGKGIDAGISTDGFLRLGEQKSSENISLLQLQNGIRLECNYTKAVNENICSFTAYSLSNNQSLLSLKGSIPEKEMTGNVALICHFETLKKQEESPEAGISFSNWKISGTKVIVKPEQQYGPIYFAQYTLNDNILKLSAQLAPVPIDRAEIVMELFQNGQWKKAGVAKLKPVSRNADFRIENWKVNKDVPYRVKYSMPLTSGISKDYFYEGTIVREPADKSKLKALVMSCNWDLGFPDQEVVNNASKHNADVIMFLGDQFYEPNGGFGIETTDSEKSYLDYLRKWYQFGWSYRELFRHKPCICIPDDHDVYQGNLWGSDGKDTIHNTDKAAIQDSGGYFMSGEWVNLVMETQTSHLPDPYNKETVQRGITVFYTVWNYAGISFAILEDRKWKSAPKNVLPEKSKVWNGFVENKDFDIAKYPELDTAELLGERQLEFIEEWAKDWSRNTQMKIWISATPFMCLQTFPEGVIDDSDNSSLPIPEPDVYLKGDHLAADMDSDGWPQNKRDKALKIIRKSFALQLTGDQHLPAVVHYGVDDFGDCGYTFTVPALNNIWPRRWWPQINDDHVPMPGQPAYTGNFLDGFDNKITVHAVANPRKTGLKPALLYDRVTGYGVATFDKTNRTTKMECWPRNIDPVTQPNQQYKGWPITVKQLDNYGRKAVAYLPQIKANIENPVVQVINEATNEIEYTIRINGKLFTPKAFTLSKHTIRIGEPDKNIWKEFKGVMPALEKQGVLKVKI